MEIKTNRTEEELVIEIIGRLDTTTSPELEAVLASSLDGVKKLVLGFDNLEYISSAGLRVLLSTQKKMNKQGEMIVRNPNEDVKEVFDITGFSDILTIE